MKCPKCKKETTITIISCGGDDIEECKRCGWVEDFSKPPLTKEERDNDN